VDDSSNNDEAGLIFERPVTRREVLRRGGSVALGLGLAGPLVAACGGGGDDGDGGGEVVGRAKTPADTLVVAVEGDVDTFDPAFTVGSKPSQTTIQNTFDQLTQYKQVDKTVAGITYRGVDTESIEGMLAERYEEQGNSVVFTLRDGLVYHDGTPITAKEIERGYRRVYEAEGISYFLLTMAAVPDPDQVRALDDKRLEVRMKQPNLLLMKNNTMHNTSAVSPKDVNAHKSAKDQWATAYYKKHLATGNGPFRLTEYVPGDRIVLEAFPDYYGGGAVPGKPKLKRVIQKIIPEATQRVLLLKRGEVDMIMVPPVKELDALKEDPNLKVLTFPNPRNYMLEMNTKIPPFDKKEVRQAVCFAVPYESIINDVFHGYAQPNRSIVGNGMPSSEFSYWKYDTDLKKAADLLARAGFPNGDGAPEITITVRADWEEAERSAILIQAQLNQLGLKSSIQKLAFAPFNEQEQGRKLQIWIDEWLSWVNDPWYHMSWNVSSSSPTNYTNYKNPEVDALVDKWTLSTDKEARLEGSRQAQKLVVEDAPHAYLAGPNWNVVVRKNVQGYVYYNDELNRYAYMSKA
jgi:peptide/nickel transport system substrate-binding protein